MRTKQIPRESCIPHRESSSRNQKGKMDSETVDSGHTKNSGLLGRLAAGVADAADAGAKAVNAGAEAIKTGAKRTHQAFGGEYGEIFEGNLVAEDGSYIMPDPALDERESTRLKPSRNATRSSPRPAPSRRPISRSARRCPRP